MIGRIANLKSVAKLVVAALLLFDAWAGWQWMTGREEIAAAETQLMACVGLAQSIETLRRAPTKMEETARSSDALAKLVESAVQEASLSADHIVQVTPGQPRKMGESSYLEQATSLELRDVSLRQLIEFTLAINKKAPRLQASQIAIRTPAGVSNSPGARELWNVQMTLTAHIYSPKIPTPSEGSKLSSSPRHIP